jgi:adenine-specific DNA-methyltransferase
MSRAVVKRPERRANLKYALARKFRSSPTEAERTLWRYLRRKQLGGLRFRRQHTIGPYIVDFYCSAAKLIIELDDGEHAEPDQQAYDERRSRWLETRGYRILRFWNVDILRDSNAFEIVWSAVRKAGVPLPEPFREGKTTIDLSR